MSIEELHYDFKLKMDRLNTSTTPDFLPHEIDWLLNEAQLIYVKQRFSGRPHPKGFEADTRRIHDLSTLHRVDPAPLTPQPPRS